MLARRPVQLGIREREVDAGFERRVHVREAVRRQEEDAGEVLEEAEEDGDELVAVEVGGGAGG